MCMIMVIVTAVYVLSKSFCGFIINISTDIDECDNNYDECSDICINVPGGYNCDCNNGYYLMSNGKDCEGTYACTYSYVRCHEISHFDNFRLCALLF